MDTQRIREIIAAQGGRTLELYWGSSRSLGMSAMKGELSKFSLSDTQGLSARVLDGRRMGFAFTEKLAPSDIRATVDRAAAAAGHIGEDDGNGLFESDEESGSDRFHNAELDAIDVAEKKRLTLALEQAAYDRDKRVVNVPHATYGEASSSEVIANSYGLMRSSRSNFCYAYVYLMASEGEQTSVGYWGMGGRDFAALDPGIIAGNAAEQALLQLDAREMESGTYPVVLSRDVASDLMEVFFSGRSPFFAENVQLGVSRLAGKLGQTVASSVLTITDDPFFDGPESREFDGEGIPSNPMPIIEDGVLHNYYYTLYAARRGDAQPTGHGGRAGHKSGISTAPSNVLVHNGRVDEAGLLAAVDRGVYVSDVEGLHASADPISGDFSVGAKGRMIEKGVLGHPVKNFTIASNFYDALTRISAVANDRRSDGFSTVASPALLVADLDVSGGAPA